MKRRIISGLIGAVILVSFAIELHSENLDQLQLLAAKGDIRAQLTLGLMYARGNEVLEDRAVAMVWLGMAAAQGVGFHTNLTFLS